MLYRPNCQAGAWIGLLAALVLLAGCAGLPAPASGRRALCVLEWTDDAIWLRGAAALARQHPETVIARSAVTRAIALARRNSDRFPEYETAQIIRSVMIKPRCGPHERGVLLVSFESELTKLLGLRRFQALEDAY